MRTLLAVFALILDDVAIVLIILLILWRLGLSLPLWALIILVVGLVVLSVILYRLIPPVLKQKQVTGAEGMIDLGGKVVTPLTPEGLIKVRGELWKASSTNNYAINADEEVLVVGLEGLRLFVRRKKMVGEAGVKARLASTLCGRGVRPPGAGIGQD